MITWRRSAAPRLPGCDASRGAASDGELASGVLSQAVARLDARVDGPSWRVAPYNPAHGEARRLAALDARAKAEA